MDITTGANASLTAVNTVKLAGKDNSRIVKALVGMSGNGLFKIGDCLIERDLDRISRGSQAVTVRPQVMDVLVYLASRGGQIVHTEELLEELWPGKVVTSASIYNCITELRHAFLSCDNSQPYVDTVPKRGYRLVAPVTELKQSKEAVSQNGVSPVLRRMEFIVISLSAAAVLLLAWYTWWPAAPMDKSIAVMAFENMSGDPNQEYFSDGVSEELLNTLAQIPELRVISRSSAFSFKGKDFGMPEIARQLDVGHVLEGSVRKEGNRVRITAQLIEARSDTHLWSQSYDRDLDSIIAVQNEIAAAISDALKVSLDLGSSKRTNIASREVTSVSAYDAYLLGTELLRKRGTDNVQSALRQFELAAQLDNGYALAHAQVAFAAAMLGDYGELGPGNVSRIALRHLERAEELEPDLAEVHAARAVLAYVLDSDYESTVEHARNALKLNPSHSDARDWLADALWMLGRYQEADAELEQLLVNDPLSTGGLEDQILGYGMKMQISDAHALANKLVSQNAQLGYDAHASISLQYEGRIADGLFWLLKSYRERGAGQPYDLLHWAFLLVGEPEEARRIDSELTYWDDFESGRDEEGIRRLHRLVELNPDDRNTMEIAAQILFVTGHVELSLPFFERWLEKSPEGRPLVGSGMPVIDTIRMSVARGRGGDEFGANSLMQIARQNQAARRAAGMSDSDRDMADAMIAMVDNDPDRVIAALRSSIQHGLRDRYWFDDPIFDELQADPRLVALQEELAEIVAVERDKALQLICFNNPVPDFWRPLPATCEGVVEQPVL